ncbi:MAG: cell division protein FtsX [Hyphomicrobiaceae bacterium]
MSGSYDRPPGPPTPLPPPSSPRTRGREAYYSQPAVPQPVHAPDIPHTDPRPHRTPEAHRAPDSDPRTGFDVPRQSGHSQPASTARPQEEREFDGELRVEGRPAGTHAPRTRAGNGAGVVPAGSVTSRSLTLVVSIMCFLACLTAGCVYMVNQSASAWLRDISSEVTVQIEPRDRADMDRTVRDAAAFIAKQPGIRAVKPMTHDESAALVEPWLGKSDALKALPIPRLIAIELDRSAPPDMDTLRALVATEVKGASLDDHRHWQQQIRTVTRSLALGGLGILMLVGAATTAIIVSATRSSMASNREIVEVLHLVGATDRYIAREFERHFLRLGIRAGLVGAGCAMLVFVAMPMGMELLGGNVVTMAEMRRLFGAGVLDPAGYAVLVVVVVVIAALCMLTSRFGVYRILDTQR